MKHALVMIAIACATCNQCDDNLAKFNKGEVSYNEFPLIRKSSTFDPSIDPPHTIYLASYESDIKGIFSDNFKQVADHLQMWIDHFENKSGKALKYGDCGYDKGAMVFKLDLVHDNLVDIKRLDDKELIREIRLWNVEKKKMLYDYMINRLKWADTIKFPVDKVGLKDFFFVNFENFRDLEPTVRRSALRKPPGLEVNSSNFFENRVIFFPNLLKKEFFESVLKATKIQSAATSLTQSVVQGIGRVMIAIECELTTAEWDEHISEHVLQGKEFECPSLDQLKISINDVIKNYWVALNDASNGNARNVKEARQEETELDLATHVRSHMRTPLFHVLSTEQSLLEHEQKMQSALRNIDEAVTVKPNNIVKKKEVRFDDVSPKSKPDVEEESDVDKFGFPNQRSTERKNTVVIHQGPKKSKFHNIRI